MIGSPTGEYDIASEHQVWLQVGSKLFPEYHIRGISEAMVHLRKTVGGSFNVSERRYRGSRYIVGIDLETVSGAGFIGLNTKKCELLIINFRNCENLVNLAGTIPGRVFCAMHYDCVLNIRSEGVELLD